MTKSSTRIGQRVGTSQTLSVAMATFNGALYLQAQLESLRLQTLTPHELVVTDDGSTDATLSILEEFAKAAPFPVRVYRNEKNLGYADNFFRAASLCIGDLIAFCDQDDVWLENKLQACSEAFTDPEVLLCVHSGAIWDGQVQSGARCPDYPKRQSFRALTANPLQSSFGFAMVFRKELLGIADNKQRIRSVDDDKPMAHDQWVWFLGVIFGTTVLLSEKLVLYRQHGKNLFGSPKEGANAGASQAVPILPKVKGPATELRCAAYLEQLASVCDVRWRAKALAGADFMRSAARCNALRSSIRDRSVPFLARWKAFAMMCFQRQYAHPIARSGRGGQTARRSIFRPMLKDITVGLLRP